MQAVHSQPVLFSYLSIKCQMGKLIECVLSLASNERGCGLVPRVSAGCQISIRVGPQPQAARPASSRGSQGFCSANQRYFAMTQLGQHPTGRQLHSLISFNSNCPSVLLFALKRLISNLENGTNILIVSGLKFSFVQTLKLRLFCLL